ncbi:uncharacterized protein B0T23DRAFT_404121 [Neurospora hispaniola]|uniref:Ecp2 effector protein domain-containing protein n=1 Tax=Neurospora hispaniola TaxID=588809 RepID=A0AAJ0MT24_9PEZI|nr:hypothetical protein B0T23DRAFT_404121 [Neurospora hispaniola]
MRHKALFSLLWAIISAALTSAAPSHFGLNSDNTIALGQRTTLTSSKLDARQVANDFNCVTWTDSHGDLKCNEFSIILGHPNLAQIITKNYLYIYMLNVTNDLLYTSVVNATNILEIKSALNCYGDQWKSFYSVLPWTIDMHGGNACNENAYNGPYDNTWINYAGQHLNVPDDGRCRWMNRVGFRCVVGR